MEMARASRMERLCAVGLLLCMLHVPGGGLFAPSSAFAMAEARPIAHAIASRIVQLGFMLLPGLLLATAGLALYKRQRKQFILSMVMLGALLLGPLLFYSRTAGDAATTDVAGVVTPHSGEERLMRDGRVVRLADPRVGEGQSVQEGWQEKLWQSMVDAIQEGTEQVVLVFSRQGCPWCDRLVPVLQRAIQSRAQATPPTGALSMLSAPLRVFVFDADEFGPAMNQFRVEAFPTMLVFGPPNVPPRLVPGYVPDDDFAMVLEEAATADPEVDAA